MKIKKALLMLILITINMANNTMHTVQELDIFP